MVEMKIRGIIVIRRNPFTKMTLFLREKDGDRSLLIGINPGLFSLFLSKLGGASFPRPLTHDLIWEVIKLLGAQISYAIITELKDDVLYTNLFLNSGGNDIAIDCDSVDAAMLCLNSRAPIFCDEELLNEEGVIVDTENKRITLVSETRGTKDFQGPFADFIDGLDLEGFEKK